VLKIRKRNRFGRAVNNSARQRQSLQRRHHVVCITASRSHAALVPKYFDGITPRQFVLQNVVHSFDRPRLLPMPLDQPGPPSIPRGWSPPRNVSPGCRRQTDAPGAAESELRCSAAVACPCARTSPPAQNSLPRIPVSPPMRFPIRRPPLFRHLPNGLVQRLAHPRADRESNESWWPLLPPLVPQPVDQTTFMTGRITPLVIRRHRLRQRRKSSLPHGQWCHLRTHIAVPKLIRQHYVHLRPAQRAPRPASAGIPALLHRCAALPACGSR